MSQSTVANFFVPELLADAVKIGLVGAKILAGSSAVVYRTNMPSGDVRIGETINIPYFASLGELEDVADGAPLTEVGNSSTAQQATVQRSGKLVGFTDWARYGAGGANPYEYAVSQIVDLIVRRADKALIDAASTPLSGNSNLLDVYNDGTGTVRKIDYDLVTDARMAFGDEMEDVAMLAVHSKVFGDLLKLKDSQGRPLTVDSFRDGNLPTFCGIPVKVSDRLPRLTSGAGSPTYPKYTSLVLKKGALAFWIDGGVGIENFRDITRAKDQTAVNVYWAAHRYTQLSGGTKCGVEIVTHNGSVLFVFASPRQRVQARRGGSHRGRDLSLLTAHALNGSCGINPSGRGSTPRVGPEVSYDVLRESRRLGLLLRDPHVIWHRPIGRRASSFRGDHRRAEAALPGGRVGLR